MQGGGSFQSPSLISTGLQAAGHRQLFRSRRPPEPVLNSSGVSTVSTDPRAGVGGPVHNQHPSPVLSAPAQPRTGPVLQRSRTDPVLEHPAPSQTHLGQVMERSLAGPGACSGSGSAQDQLDSGLSTVLDRYRIGLGPLRNQCGTGPAMRTCPRPPEGDRSGAGPGYQARDRFQISHGPVLARRAVLD